MGKTEPMLSVMWRIHNKKHTVAHGDAEHGWYIQTASCTRNML